MIPQYPIPESYEKLTPVLERLYHQTAHVAQLALLPLFLLSVLFAYSQDLGLQGAVVARLKKLVITALLLAAFPSLTELIRTIGQEIALSIDDLGGIDNFFKLATNKSASYSVSVKSLLDFGNDLIVAALVQISYVLLYFARYILVAFYHFYWMILIATGPFMILGNLFEGTSALTKNLVKSLMLVASWPIVWSILSAFLKALPYQDAYALEGGYNAVVIMNLIIAVAMLFSPFMLSQFCEGAIVGIGAGIVSTGARAATAFVGPKAYALAANAGAKAHTQVARYVPGKKLAYQAYSKLSAATKLSVLVLLVLPSLALASQTVINVRPGLSSVLCFAKVPDSIAIGDGRFFQAQKVGKNLLLRSNSPNKETNLLIFSGGELAASYKLQSNLVYPHSESIECERKPLQAIPPKEALQVKVRSSVVIKGLRAELLRKTWASPKHDYLTLRVRLTNSSDSIWRPDWSNVRLKQGTKYFGHSGLRAERRELTPGGKSVFDIQFTRIELSNARCFLAIPSNAAPVELLIDKGEAK